MSALAHLYPCTGFKPSEEMETKLKHFMGGMKCTVAKARKNDGDVLDEGKRPMSKSVYEKMCQILCEGGDDEYLFAHAFLTIEWNLMARSDNVVNSHVNHIRWDGNSLQFFSHVKRESGWRAV